MGIVIQIFGILIVSTSTILALASIILKAKWVVDAKSNKGFVITIYTITVIVGVVMILSPRITKLNILKFGTIDIAVEKAVLDAKLVADIKQRVEAQSATIDLVAKQASEVKKLFQDLEDKNELVDKRLGALDEKIQESTQILSDLQLTREFTMTVIAAQNNDRKAFDQLRIWADDESYLFTSRAEQAWNTILEEHNKPYSVGGFKVPWTEGFDPSKLTLPKLAQQYLDAPAHLKPALLEYIWNRTDIPKIDRLDFMLNVMQIDSSLTAVEYAGRYFTSGTNQKIKPLAVEYLVKWWREHRQEFKEK